tara:strand:- start:400 stop:996 length:597 start_codon:yes stop_codon:yes gene_type:complete
MSKKYIETSIHFGGFYESIHDGNIDNMVEAYEYDFDDVDYKKTFKSYIESYSSKLESYILDEYLVDIDFKNIKLYSPQYYNYSTDIIDCKIDTNQVNSLNEILKKDNEFLSFLKDRTTSYSGFVSFYSYDQALNNKDNKLIMYVLEYICNKFNDKEIVYGEIEFEIYLTDDGEKKELEKIEANKRQIEFESKQLSFQY